MLKPCRRCGLLFLPSHSAEDKCGICSRPKQTFGRKPIDLWNEWADDGR